MPEPQTLTINAFVQGMVACRANADELIADADILSNAGKHARAYALFYTACEELGKFAVLEIGAAGLLRGKPPRWKRFWQRFRSHDSKSAQLEVQLLRLAISSGNTDEFNGLADLFFVNGIGVRNAALYVDIGPDRNFRKPSDIDYSVPTPTLRVLATHALAATYRCGTTPAEIESYLQAPPTIEALSTAEKILVRAFERMRDAGIEKEKMHEIIEKHMK